MDWYAELIDRKCLFLKVPDVVTVQLPGWTSKRTELLLGVLGDDTFTGISWELATPRGRKLARETLGEDKARQLEQFYKLARASQVSSAKRPSTSACRRAPPGVACMATRAASFRKPFSCEGGKPDQ